MVLRRFHSWIGVLSVVSLALITIFLGLFGFSFMHFTNEWVSEEIDVISQYRYLRYDTQTNETLSGFISISTVLDKDEFISYSSNNKHHLISNFGSTEYKCFGSCVCVDDERRSSAVLMKRGLIFLVAAISSITAMKISKDHFHVACEAFLMETDSSCKAANTRSEVHECTKLKKEQTDDDDNLLEYMCKGECMATAQTKRDIQSPNSFLKYLKPIEDEEFFDCTNLKNSGTVTIDPKDVEKRGYDFKRYGVGETLEEKLEYLAINKFEWYFLAGWCWYNSEFEYTFDYPNAPEDQKRGVGHWCFSGTLKSSVNPATRCVRLSKL